MTDVITVTDNGGTASVIIVDNTPITQRDVVVMQDVGFFGAQGPKGDTGAQGPQGIQGPQGPAGTNGTNGTNGSDGQGFLWRGAWATSTVYAAYDVVRQDGSSYRCSVAHTSSASTQPGIGASWASYWSLMAQKGDTGATGATGATGSTGATGATGPGVVTGGTTGQVLSKIDGTNYNTQWVTPNAGTVTSIATTSPITGGTITGSGTIGINDASTTQKGAVQLTDSISSTSTTTAATPNAVKTAYDLANAAIPSSQKGAANGVAPLDSSSKVPATNLPAPSGSTSGVGSIFYASNPQSTSGTTRPAIPTTVGNSTLFAYSTAKTVEFTICHGLGRSAVVGMLISNSSTRYSSASITTSSLDSNTIRFTWNWPSTTVPSYSANNVTAVILG